MDETENTSRSERFLSYIPKHLFKVPINFRNASCSGWAQYVYRLDSKNLAAF